MGPYPDLHRPGHVDDAFLHGVVEHRPVVDAPVLVAPRIAVGIEVHQGQRAAVVARMGPEQGQGDEVVATDGEDRRPGAEDGGRVALDAGGDLAGTAVVRRAVSGVDDGETLRRVEAPRPGRPPRKLCGCGPDRARPETRARAVGGREIEGDAGDRDVGAFRIAYVRAPEEAESPRVRRFVTHPVGRPGGERGVPCVFDRHVSPASGPKLEMVSQMESEMGSEWSEKFVPTGVS